MKENQVKALLTAFLQHHKTFSEEFNPSWLEGLSEGNQYAPYESIATLINQFADHDDAFLPLCEIADSETPASHADFDKMMHLLSEGCIFRRGVLPPEISEINTEKIEKAYLAISSVVDANYANRVTSIDDDDETFKALQEQALERIALVYDNYSEKSKIGMPERYKDLTDTQVKKVIKDLSEMKKQGELRGGQRQCLNLFQDIQNIRDIKPIAIPREDGIKKYCQIASAVEGATEKESVISLETAQEKLRDLIDKIGPVSATAWTNYNTHRQNFKISPQGIIKFPKPKRFSSPLKTEVQREHIALNVGRILFEHVTQSTILTHNDKPCLFVPFDEMSELREMTSGRVCQKWENKAKFKSLEEDKDTYFTESTINPLNEGLRGVSPEMVDDFGDKLAYFYMCCDPDAVGGYNQNKGLIDSQHFYLFDQVVMDKDYFRLDSSLSLRPTNTMTRHTEGRNRSIIQDGSFNQKFNSVYSLLDKAPFIQRMLTDVIAQHESTIQDLETLRRHRPLTTKENDTLKDVATLKADAELIQGKITERFKSLQDNAINRDLSRDENRKILLLQKLLNKPVLFNALGRPYRYPFTDEHACKIKLDSVEKGASNVYKLQFHSPPTKVMLDYLNHRLGRLNKDAIRYERGGVLVSEETLDCLKEEMLFPEHGNAFSPDEDYLSLTELSFLKESYPQDKTTRGLFSSLNEYQRDYPTHEPATQIRLMNAMMSRVDHYINGTDQFPKAKQQGLIKHVKLKLQNDIQQKIVHHCTDSLPDRADKEAVKEKLIKAFDAAVKLDCVDAFQQTCLAGLTHDRINTPEFDGYIEGCIKHGEAAGNYTEGIERARILAEESSEMLDVLQRPMQSFRTLHATLSPTTEEEGVGIKLGGLGIDVDMGQEAEDDLDSLEKGYVLNNEPPQTESDISVTTRESQHGIST